MKVFSKAVAVLAASVLCLDGATNAVLGYSTINDS